MNTLYLDRRDTQLQLDGRRVIIRVPGQRPAGIALSLLERVVIQGRAELDTTLLAALGKQGTDILLLSGRHGRRRAYLRGAGHNDARRRLGQYQLCHRADLRLAWSKRLIQAKIQSQHALLASAGQRRPDQRRALLSAQETLQDILLAVSPAPSQAVLLGLEGAAAAAYFAAYQTLFAASLGFSGRQRRPPPDPVNACLSLTYTLLHNDAVRACHIAGLDSLLGFYHEPAYGRESLACDLIEPLRPRADSLVWWLFRKRVLRAESFSQTAGGCQLGKAGRRVFYASYETAVKPWRRYLRLHAFRLAKAILTLAPELPVVDRSVVDRDE